jgi:hypothetical protein
LLSVRRPIETSLVIYDYEHGLRSIVFLTYFWGKKKKKKLMMMGSSCILYYLTLYSGVHICKLRVIYI